VRRREVSNRRTAWASEGPGRGRGDRAGAAAGCRRPAAARTGGRGGRPVPGVPAHGSRRPAHRGPGPRVGAPEPASASTPGCACPPEPAPPRGGGSVRAAGAGPSSVWIGRVETPASAGGVRRPPTPVCGRAASPGPRGWAPGLRARGSPSVSRGPCRRPASPGAGWVGTPACGWGSPPAASSRVLGSQRRPVRGEGTLKRSSGGGVGPSSPVCGRSGIALAGWAETGIRGGPAGHGPPEAGWRGPRPDYHGPPGDPSGPAGESEVPCRR
jgi:hypothetical protein